MTKQERYLLERQIKMLEERKQFLIDDLVARCEEINTQIRFIRKCIKDDNFSELKDCTK